MTAPERSSRELMDSGGGMMATCFHIFQALKQALGQLCAAQQRQRLRWLTMFPVIWKRNEYRHLSEETENRLRIRRIERLVRNERARRAAHSRLVADLARANAKAAMIRKDLGL